MADGNLRQIRIMHFVSSGGLPGAVQPSLFMPLLTKMPKQRVKMQVASLSPGFTPAAVLRQSGVPVHDIALSKKRFTTAAFGELVTATRQFRPDVIQAWGHTAQLAALAVRSRCDWKPKVVWSVGDTAPLPKRSGLIDKQKLKFTAKYSSRADRIIYTSEAAASQHRRVGYPDKGHLVVPPGVDPARFKPDFATRRKIRDQLGLAADAFVIGMVAPFQPEYDHPTFIKGVGELIKTNPKIAVLLAGHGVQKGNAPLMALVGGGTLGARTQLLGEWTDVASFYNACDVACSSAQTDGARMNLVMAMLCGVPCVATGMGGQGEVVGQFGVAIEPNSPTAFVRGFKRVMEMTPEKRVFMAQGARKHALTNFVYVRSLQKYMQLYFDVIGRESLATEAVPTPEIDASIPAPPPDLYVSTKSQALSSKAVSMADLSDPDSIEARVDERPEKVKAASDVDVLQVFETHQSQAAASASASPMGERARGVAEELEDLLSPEDIHVAAPAGSAANSVIKPAAVVKPAAAAAAIKPKAEVATASTPVTRPIVDVTPPPVAAAAEKQAEPAVASEAPPSQPSPASRGKGSDAPAVAVVTELASPVLKATPVAEPVPTAATSSQLAVLTDTQVQKQISLPLAAQAAQAPEFDEGSLQLELLPEPVEERKIAVGD